LIKVDNEVVLLNVSAFCNKVCEAVRSWLADVGTNQAIKDRMKELISIKIDSFMLQSGVKVS
jgi:hypothetical protein